MEHVNAVVTFSPEVNCLQLSNNPIINAWKQRRLTRKNIRKMDKLLDKMAVSCQLNGWTINKNLTGKYLDDHGVIHKEKSVSVELLFTNTYSVEKFALELCAAFKQESVLVRYITYDEVKMISGNGEKDKDAE